ERIYLSKLLRLLRIINVVYISYQPLTKKFEENFYINRAQKEGFNVEYWDISSLYHKNLKMSGTLEKDLVKQFFSFKQLEREAINYKDNSIFIFAINYYAD